MRRSMLALLCVAFTGVMVGAQGMPNPLDLEAKMATALAGANKPGDAALGCEAIQRELLATVKDPALQAVGARQGAWAQQQIDKVSVSTGVSTATAAAQMVMGLASPFAPGIGGATTAGMGAVAVSAQAALAQALQAPAIQAQVMQAQMIQSQAMQARAIQAQAAMMEQQMTQRMQELITILPQLMRSQRLVQLSQARKCEWAPLPTVSVR